MSWLNVLTCSVESCFVAGRRRYIVGARAAIVASAPVAKRSSEELNLRSDMAALEMRII